MNPTKNIETVQSGSFTNVLEESIASIFTVEVLDWFTLRP
jgi:hypothetical protein